MTKFILIRIIGILGLLLVLGGYYLLWSTPNGELEGVVIRTRTAILMTLFGNIMILFYLFKR